MSISHDGGGGNGEEQGTAETGMKKDFNTENPSRGISY